MAAEKKAKFLEVKQSGTRLMFVLADGQTAQIDAGTLSDAMRERAMFHGLNQKIRDAAAGFSKEADYDGAFEAMAKVIGALESGEWERKGGAAAANLDDLATAIAQIRNVDVAKAKAAVEKATPDQRAGWAKNARVAAIMADLKAQRLAEKAKAATDDDLSAIDLGMDDGETDGETDEAAE